MCKASANASKVLRGMVEREEMEGDKAAWVSWTKEGGKVGMV